MTATLNDDPETLKAILDTAKDWIKTQLTKSQVLEKNPLLLASLDGYTDCMKLLYHAGYRIKLYEEDEKLVKSDESLRNKVLKRQDEVDMVDKRQDKVVADNV